MIQNTSPSTPPPPYPPPPPPPPIAGLLDVHAEVSKICHSAIQDGMRQLGEALRNDVREELQIIQFCFRALCKTNDISEHVRNLSANRVPHCPSFERPSTCGPPSLGLPGSVQEEEGIAVKDLLSVPPQIGSDSKSFGGFDNMCATSPSSTGSSRIPKSAGRPSKQNSEDWKPRPAKALAVVNKNIYKKTAALWRRTETDVGEFSLLKNLRNGDVTFKEGVPLFIKSEYFDYTMGFFLVANAIIIGLQVNYMAGQTSTVVPMIFRILDGVFCIIFLLEISLRISVLGLSWFSGFDSQWNLFDMVVVSFQILDEIVKLFLADSDLGKTLNQFGLLRILRLARILRLLRMVRLLPELKHMVYLISASMTSFGWTSTLIMILVYITAVYYTDCATDLRNNNTMLGPDDQESLEAMFGSISSAILCVFQAIAGGEDWGIFLQPFQTDGVDAMSSICNTFLFVLYIGFATLVMLNLVTGVFVEGAQRLIYEEKDVELLRQVRKLFHVTSEDGLHREILWPEFQDAMQSKQTDEFFAAIDVQCTGYKLDPKKLFDLLDTDGSGTINVHEIVRGCMQLKGPARSMDLSSLQVAFDEFARNVFDEFARNVVGDLNSILEMLQDIQGSK